MLEQLARPWQKTPGRYWYRVIGSLLALDWLEVTVHHAVNTPSRNYGEGLEIGENGEYDQKNLMKIAIEATEARIQTNM